MFTNSAFIRKGVIGMHNREMSRALKWVAVVILLFGALCCMWNIFTAEFNDRNLGLMIGIGFLVGGSQILLFGVVAPLLHKGRDAGRAAKDPS